MEKVGAYTDRATESGEWRPGAPGAGQSATPMLAAYFNMLQRELLGVVQAAGLAPDKDNDAQLLEAFRRLRGGAASNFGQWAWSDSLDGSPGAGGIALDEADPSLASEMFISEASAESIDFAQSLTLLRAGDTITFQLRDSTVLSHRFRVTGPAVDQGTYRTIPIAYVSGEGDLPEAGAVVSVLFTQAGASDAAVPLFSVQWWPSRAAIPAGYAPADGQALPRATYPDAWEGILAGNVPTVAEATWQATPAERGKYTAGDGASTFRLPDYNGQAAGSLGAVFLRGDGALSAAIAGLIQQDQIQDHRHECRSTGNSTGTDSLSRTGLASAYADVNENIGNVLEGRTGSETRPLNVTGCWVIKLFGAVTNPGSADAAQLATDYAALAARVSILEQLPFISGQQVITAGGALTIPHGLGVRPFSVVMDAVCVTADLGYSVGDYLYDMNGVQVSLNGMTSITADATNIYVRFGSTAPSLPNKGTGAGVSITPARWSAIFRASKR